jgi:ATP-dependent DNA ligase
MYHSHRELIQFTPARAKKKCEVHDIPRNMYVEQKIDGERYVIHSGVGGPYANACTSRRESVVTGRMVEKTDRVPHLMQLNLPTGSLFDCEFVSSGDIVKIDLPGYLWDKLDSKWHLDYIPVYPHVGNTVSIMGSDGPLAVQKQEERGLIWAYCFDIIQFNDQSLTHNSQLKRRRFLQGIFEGIDPASGMILMPAWLGLSPQEVEELFYLVTDVKGEGLILKDPNEPYNAPKNWYKMKIDFPIDAVLTGNYEMGKEGATGKMLGLVGTLEIGVWHAGVLQPVGWISAIMDSEAKLPQLTKDALAGQLRGRVVECRHNGIQVKEDTPLGITLRHPRFRRNRSDKNNEDCTALAMINECENDSTAAYYAKKWGY